MIPLEEQAIRLNPRDHNISSRYFVIGVVHLLQSRNDEAILWFVKARSANPALPYIPLFLASAYALKGETELAAAELAEARRLRGATANIIANGGGAYSSLARLKASIAKSFRSPATRALFETTYIAGLRKAGMPEE